MQIPDVSNWTHQIDASTAECFIYTFKDSMLSTVAHDLKLCVEEFEVAIDEPTRSVAAIFDTRSIHVVHAMRDGVELPQLLSEENKREIDLQIRISVLDTRTYPEILFVSKAVTPSDNGGYVVRGQLELCGVTREIVFPVRRESGAYVAEANVYQPDFGITPYSGLMGTMRIRPGVLVRLTIPAP